MHEVLDVLHSHLDLVTDNLESSEGLAQAGFGEFTDIRVLTDLLHGHFEGNELVVHLLCLALEAV